MSDKATGVLSREQEAIADFAQAMTQLRSRSEKPETSSALDGMSEAIIRFASCEFRMRRLERIQALGYEPADVKTTVERFFG